VDCVLCNQTVSKIYNDNLQTIKLCGPHLKKLQEVCSIPPRIFCHRCNQHNRQTTISGETLCQSCWNESRCKQCQRRHVAPDCGDGKLCSTCYDPPSWDDD